MDAPPRSEGPILAPSRDIEGELFNPGGALCSPALIRFLALSLPLLVLSFALFHFGWEALGMPSPGPPAGRELLGSWLLQSLGLTGLFLFVYGRSHRLMEGLVTAWAAWIFRGPILVLTVTSVAPGSTGWDTLAMGWLGLYTFCGLLLAALAAAVGLRR